MLLMALLTTAIVMVVAELLPKKYTATTTVLVDVKSPDPVVAMFQPANLATQVDIINSERTAQRVVRMLGLAEAPGVRDQWMSATGGKGTPELWLAGLLLRGLGVGPSRDSNMVYIAYTGSDPAFAAAVANGFAQAYIDVSIELKVDPARQYARWFGDQGKTLRDNLEKAQNRLFQFQQEKGLIARDERMDAESARLQELSSQLVRVQEEINDARSKQRSGANGDRLPEVMRDAVVGGLRTEIGRQEAKLQEAGLNLGKNHPQYQRMQSELAALRQKLATETQRVTSSFAAMTAVGTERESKLRAAIDEQKKRLLEIRNERDQLAVLQRDLDVARNADEAVTKRYTETELASRANQSNISVLTPAAAPIEPSFPKPMQKMALIAVGLGLLVAFGTAALLEMLNRRVRSVTDLATVLPLPVLGVITKARGRRHLPFFRSPSPALLTR
ncbi:MAG: epsF [Betaproteobacteria bacterium]|nr:epsF [Betaproteobacteria bacterium]